MTPWTAACEAPLSMEILQARILEQVAMPYSKGSYQSRDRTQVFCIQEDSLLSETPGHSKMDYYLVIKKNEMMTFAAIWMDLEIVIMSEENQAKKDKYHMILLICGIKKKRYI